MKQLQLILILTLSSFMVTGQAEVKEDKTIKSEESKPRMETFTKKGSTHGIYLGIGGGFTNIGGNGIGQFHARLAYVADQTFEFGFEGQSFQGITRINGSDNAILTAGGFGGIHFKGIIYGNKKIHIGIPLFLGVGAIAQAEGDASDLFEGFDADFETFTPALVIDPGVNIEFNINKFMGAEFGVKYRLSSSFSVEEDSLNNLNGWIIGGTFKFGFFDFGGNKKKHKKSKLYNENDTYNNY